MRIKEELNLAGFFWLPSDQGTKLPGTLTISDGGEIILEIVGVFENNFDGLKKVIEGKYELVRIVGQVEKYGNVTLEKCFYTDRNLFSNGIPRSRIVVNQVYMGVAYEQDEQVLFNTLRFSVEGIGEWVGISGIKVEYELKEPTASIFYTPPEKKIYHLSNNMDLQITFSYTLPGTPHLTEAKIT